MAKRTRPLLPSTEQALSALGAQIGAARRETGWTASELAERLGVGVQLIRRIEQGEPTTSVGTVFEAAVLCGVRLFGVDAADLPSVAERERGRAALLPSRVRHRKVEVSDDF